VLSVCYSVVPQVSYLQCSATSSIFTK
jgi:hypothetical protein